MARTKSPISIKVSDSETNDTRTVNICITAQPSTFWLSNILVNEGLIDSLSNYLKKKLNENIIDYVDSNKKLIKSIKKP